MLCEFPLLAWDAEKYIGFLLQVTHGLFFLCVLSVFAHFALNVIYIS